jgi:hypothetical protein
VLADPVMYRAAPPDSLCGVISDELWYRRSYRNRKGWYYMCIYLTSVRDVASKSFHKRIIKENLKFALCCSVFQMFLFVIVKNNTV